ncbi:MAG: tetratricopeptide repeat protein, partial [Candidatus Eisenbacteria bacterium]
MGRRVLALAVVVVLLCPAAGGSSDSGPGSGRTNVVLTQQALNALKEFKLNNGIASLSSFAHAYYKSGVEKRSSGDRKAAITAFEMASELDPHFLDPHFSLFRAHLFSDPGRAFTELSAVMDITRKDFLAQHFLANNLIVMGYLALFIALALFCIMTAVNHISRLKHALSERWGMALPQPAANWLGVLLVIQPLVWGLGLAGTVLSYNGALWKCTNAREKFFSLLFLLLVLCSVVLASESIRWLPALSLDSPTYASYVVLRGGLNTQTEDALLASLQTEPKNPLYHYAYGTAARRAGRLGIARQELETAARLSPGDAAYLNNLGNVYFNLQNLGSAEQLYLQAIEANPSLPQPHYNLAQVFTKKLMFNEANDAIKKANQLDFELVNDFSLDSREQLNRSVIDAQLPPLRFWRNVSTETRKGYPPSFLASVSSLLGTGTARRGASVLVFYVSCLVAGILVFRNLYTYRCTNCGRVVCRKCMSRIHRKIVCLKCAVAASSMKSEEFTRLLLDNQLRLERKKTRPIFLFFEILVP